MILKILIIFLCATLTMSLYLNQAPTMCYTPSCFNAADYIRGGLDESVNPCDDFYAFTCNNYLKKQIPDYYSSYSEFTTINSHQSEKITTLLKELTDKNSHFSKSKSAELIYRLHDGCVKSYGNKQLALDKAKEILEEFGGWVAANEGDLPKVDWTEIAFKLFANGFNANIFVPLSITHNAYEKGKHALDLGGPFDLYVSSRVLNQDFGEPELKTYMDAIIELAKDMGATNVPYAEEEAKKIIEVERIMAQTKTEHTTSQITVSELQTKYPAISWKTYLSKMTNIDVKDDDAVMPNVGLRNISDMLSTIPQRTLASYVQYRAISQLTRAVGFHMFYGLDVTPDNDCLELTKNNLPIAISALYVRKYMPKEIKQQITELVGNVKSTFVSLIRANGWADNATKEAAIKKIQHQYDLIAYPDELLDDKIVDKYYEPVEYKDNFLEFLLSISKSTKDAKYSKFRTVPKRDDWENNAFVTDVGAYYSFLTNRMRILAGMIASPFYNPNFPNYMNYASIGFTVGHEINHGVSGLGFSYDENGLNRFWASDQVLAKLNETSNCLRSQYALKHNDEAMARRTSNEDQADATGVVAGYLAYQSWIQSHSNEGRLPSLGKYTANQLFWISFGRFLCHIETQRFLDYNSINGKYPPSIYRVQVPLMNSEEFSNDFKCPSGSPMNPVKKCKIWN